MSTEELLSTIWGQVVTNIRDEILCNGEVEADTKLQRRFSQPISSNFLNV